MSASAQYLELLKLLIAGSMDGDEFVEVLPGTFRLTPIDMDARNVGRDWPQRGCSMVGAARLTQVQHAVETIVAEGVHGDVLEAGVWRGGVGMLMAATLDSLDDGRVVWLADSFSGFPVDETDPIRGAALALPYLSVTTDSVRETFLQHRVPLDRVRFIEGWFADTLPVSPVASLSLVGRRAG